MGWSIEIVFSSFLKNCPLKLGLVILNDSKGQQKASFEYDFVSKGNPNPRTKGNQVSKVFFHDSRWQ